MTTLSTYAVTEQDARRLTERIRIAAINYSDAKDKLMTLVQQAKEDAVHLALGYASWTAYLADVMGEEPLRLARGERQEVVQMLSAEGMSTRAIAPIVGVSNKTVSVDLAESREVLPEVTPAPVQGMDGKTYIRQEPGRETPDTPSREVAIINDIRLYLAALGSSKEIAALSATGKQHIINALNKAATKLKEN